MLPSIDGLNVVKNGGVLDLVSVFNSASVWPIVNINVIIFNGISFTLKIIYL